MPASQGHFAELIQDRCGRRVDQGVEDRDRQQGSIAFRNLSQDGDLGFLEFGEGDDVELLDLVGIRAERLARLCPDDDGRHSKARTRGEIIELPEHVRRREPQPDLLKGFTQRGFDDRFIAVEAATRKRELAPVVSEAGRTTCDEKTGLVVLIGRDDEGDGGRAQVGIRLKLALETRQVRDDACSKCGVEDMGLVAHGDRA